MEFTQEAIEEERTRLSFNHRGFSAPLMHRRIKSSDTLALSRAIKKSHKHLRGYIGWAAYAGKWDFRQIQRFVNDHVNDEFPREHFLFFIGNHSMVEAMRLPIPWPWKPSATHRAIWISNGCAIGAREPIPTI